MDQLPANIHILSFDDNEDDAALLKAELNKSLPQVIIQHVKKKKDFISHLVSREWDVILSAYYIEEIYKVEALKLCQKLSHGTPVIYVSGNLGEDVAVELLKAGATDYILKSNLPKLSFAIIRAVKEAQQQRQHQKDASALKVRNHAMDNAGVGIFISSPENGEQKIIYANTAAKILTGYKEEELIGKISSVLDGKETSKTVLDEISKKLKKGIEFNGEIIQYRKNGEAFWSNLTMSPVFNDAGYMTHVISIIKDITQEKKLEEEITKTNALFKEVQSISKIGIWQYVINQDKMQWSQQICDILHIPYDQVKSLADSISHFHPKYQEYVHDMIYKSIKWRTKFDLDALVITAGGRSKWIRLSGYPVFDSEKVVEIRGLFMDIDERKQQNLELEKKHKEALQYQSMLLSTQINPHFIFNSLNAVQFYILDQNIEPAINFISDFSMLMRGVLSNSMHNYISIKSEMDWLKKYLDLESARFSNKFNYSISVDDGIDVEETQIPTMLLQPFVENAIIHGIGPMDTGGQINIRIKKEKDKVVCLVDDNGIGRKKAMELGKLRNGDRLHTSYGMSITRTKIELLNELENGMFDYNVTDKENRSGVSEGTKVEISYPITLS